MASEAMGDTVWCGGALLAFEVALRWKEQIGQLRWRGDFRFPTPPFYLPLLSLLLIRAHESPCLRVRVLRFWVSGFGVVLPFLLVSSVIPRPLSPLSRLLSW